MFLMFNGSHILLELGYISIAKLLLKSYCTIESTARLSMLATWMEKPIVLKMNLSLKKIGCRLMKLWADLKRW